MHGRQKRHRHRPRPNNPASVAAPAPPFGTAAGEFTFALAAPPASQAASYWVLSVEIQRVRTPPSVLTYTLGHEEHT